MAPIIRKRSAGLIGARGFRRRLLRYRSCASRQLLVASNNSEHDAFSVTILHLVGNRPGVRSPSEPVVQRQHHPALIHYKLSLRVVLYSVSRDFYGVGGSHQVFGSSAAHTVAPGKIVPAFPTRPVCRATVKAGMISAACGAAVMWDWRGCLLTVIGCAAACDTDGCQRLGFDGIFCSAVDREPCERTAAGECRSPVSRLVSWCCS